MSGFIDDGWFRGRRAEFLRFATQNPPSGSLTNAIAHFARAEQDSRFHVDPAALKVADYDSLFRDFDRLRDTTDFDMLYMLNLWEGYRDHLSPEVRQAIERAMHRFKYWYTEPTTKGVVDNRWYWSENHRIIYHTLEYLAGSAFPDDKFTNDGRLGAQHRNSARRLIEKWLDEKVRFGWSEWHSDVYYQKDATPLLTLVEFAPDSAIAQRAAIVLDLLLTDIALHVSHGNFGASRGRSYMKDKSTALDQDTFAMSKLLFDDTTEPYPSGDDAGAVLFARARKYRLPEVIRRIATSPKTSIDKERMGVALDPQAPIDLRAAAPYGYAFDDPANVEFWWERGAQATWQGVGSTLKTLTQYDLWKSNFFSSFVPLRDAVGGDPNKARPLARQLAPMLGFGLLTEVNSYTWRSPEVMLSTAQDHRFGMFSEQAHAWQATLGTDAIVFTTHPKNEPETGTQWPDSDGYWTGTGSMPASAQQGRAAIHVYDPAFAAPGKGALEAFDYLDYTHAYFPQERFDEVVTDGHWVFGRKGNGYVALWSQRPPQWRTAPAGTFTHGLQEPFDLVAPGSARNVWIVEVGDAAHDQSFAAFRRALSSAPISVDDTPGEPTRHVVTFASPAEGTMVFDVAHGSPGRLRVDNRDIAIRDYPRFDNPWVHADFEARRFAIKDANASLELDFDHGTRHASS